MKTHTPGRASTSSALYLLFRLLHTSSAPTTNPLTHFYCRQTNLFPHTHTHTFHSYLSQYSRLISSLSFFHSLSASTFFFSVPSYCCTASVFEPLERIDAMNVGVCVCARGIFHIAFYFESKESWGSEATLFFHERDRVFSKLPLRQTEREMRRERK